MIKVGDTLPPTTLMEYMEVEGEGCSVGPNAVPVDKATAGKTIDIPDLINNNKIGSFQIGMLILCGLCVIMDGFDVQAMGYVAPAIIADWHVSKANLGPVFGAGLLGMLVGSLVFSITADKFGRRPVLIGSTIFFSLCMLVTPLATNIEQLQLIRFITGLGLGAVMPNAMALSQMMS